MKTRKFIVSILFALPLLGAAQAWKYESTIKPATAKGYQDIFLPPAFTCRLAPDAGNIRLLDANDEEVPFLHTADPIKTEEAKITWLSRVDEDYWSRWYSRSFFENPSAVKHDRLVLKIRNADVHQDFWLSGSDDLHHWYIVKENFGYDASYDPSSTWSLLTIHFPPTDYKYYKVEIRHYWREPIQIMGAGFYGYAQKEGNSQALPEPTISQSEEDKSSIVDIAFDGPQYLDQILFEVDGPERYLRVSKLQKQLPDGNFETITEFNLSSKNLNQLPLEHLRGAKWRLVIDNKDDKPLRIAAVQARQGLQFVTAKLDPAVAYRLVAGEESLAAPEYDLRYFEADLPQNRPRAQAQEVRDLSPKAAPVASSKTPNESKPTAASSHDQTPPEPAKAFYEQKAFLWLGIGAIILLVGGMSIALLKDMKKKEGGEAS